MQKTVVLIFGTRPEAIKMFPVYQALKNVDNIKTVVISSGQHTTLLKNALNSLDFDITHDLVLDRKRPDLPYLLGELTSLIGQKLTNIAPSLVLVHGDTTTALAGALAAHNLKIKIGHVEAGLRSHDLNAPWPEEANRQLISRVADLNFAPTNLARANLLAENVKPEKIFVTGNTVVDALKHVIHQNSADKDTMLKLFDIETEHYVLVTCHRRENIDNGLVSIFSAIRILAQSYSNLKFLFPVHLNPSVSSAATKHLGGIDNVILTQPLEYDKFLVLLANCKLVISDSGGIQEEAPSFGKVVLTTRETTERPEAVESGHVFLVGSNATDIINQFNFTLKFLNEGKVQVASPFGYGDAGQQITDILLENI